MRDIHLLEHNIFVTADNGTNYRAVKVGCGKEENSSHSSHWRLAKETKKGCSWTFVNETKYRSGADAIADIDYL